MSSSSGPNKSGQLLEGVCIALVGKLASMGRREAQRLLRAEGALLVDSVADGAALVVVGDDELPLGDLGGGQDVIDLPTREAALRGELSIITETQLWQRLGLIDGEQQARRLYTPAMLADLLGISRAVVRRWHRKGLIVPVREVRRLPYFDFQEVATARRLADLLAAGCSPQAIERQLADISRYLPGVERPLAQLSVIVQGKQLLLRQGDGLVEPGGQLRLDFDTVESTATDAEPTLPHTVMPLVTETVEAVAQTTPEEMLLWAAEFEDQGALEEATEMYRAALAATTPRADVNFMLAELLYRIGDLTAARERYYVAIELDEDYVEARANLGCVLAETGQRELAVAAFRGALAYHSDYADVHYHLARTLDELSHPEEAELHWDAFLQLAPSSPWADEARLRLDR